MITRTCQTCRARHVYAFEPTICVKCGAPFGRLEVGLDRQDQRTLAEYSTPSRPRKQVAGQEPIFNAQLTIEESR